MIKTIFLQIIAQSAGTQDIIKKSLSYDPRGRKSGSKTVAFLLRLSIFKLVGIKIFTILCSKIVFIKTYGFIFEP